MFTSVALTEIMLRYSCLLALFSLVAVCIAEDQQQCFDQLKKFGECMKQNIPHQPPANNSAGMQQFVQCFTQNGCTAPGKQGPKERGARPPPGGDSEKCFKVMMDQLGGEFKQCLQNKNVSVPESGPPHHGHHGGPGGPGGVPDELVAQQCNNDDTKTQQVKSCLQQLKPAKEEAKAKFDQMCQAETTCKQQSPISQECHEQLQKTGQAVCQCRVELKEKFETASQQESSCANVKLPPTPSEQDCVKQYQSPCEEGFEAVYAKISN